MKNIKGKITAILVCTLMGISVFAVLLQIERSMMKKYETGYVVRASEYCPAGLEITTEM